jgi:hypothetical protein
VGQRIALLVTTKAYPQPDIRHGEAICVVGVRTDMDRPEWVRLHPVPFDDLDPSRRFKKYQLIGVEARRSQVDTRPESLLPNCDTLELGRFVDARARWADRRRFLEPLVIDSMCALQRDQKSSGTSLGFFKPAVVESFDWEAVPRSGRADELPYRFRYHYRCADPSCAGHSQMVVDWELAESFKGWKSKYGSEEIALENLRRIWLDEMCGPEKDTYFFAGNMAKDLETFLILGVFWPKGT